jgi:hypothetical protein
VGLDGVALYPSYAIFAPDIGMPVAASVTQPSMVQVSVVNNWGRTLTPTPTMKSRLRKKIIRLVIDDTAGGGVAG